MSRVILLFFEIFNKLAEKNCFYFLILLRFFFLCYNYCGIKTLSASIEGLMRNIKNLYLGCEVIKNFTKRSVFNMTYYCHIRYVIICSIVLNGKIYNRYDKNSFNGVHEMRTLLKTIKKKQDIIGVSDDTVLILENIVDKYFVPGRGSVEGDNKFIEAIGQHFTYEQRINLWEISGGCLGTGHEKARKLFAAEHAEKPLPVRLELYCDEFANGFNGKTRNIVLNEDDNTITFTFACDECYKHTISGKKTAPFSLYYECCAGGRMMNLETALGIKLKIKSVDIQKQGVSKENPCVFTFEIVE